MLRTKVTSCLKPRLLSASVRCYKYRRAHGALTRELSEGGTEYDRTRRPSNGLRGGQGQRPGRAGRVARSSLAGNSGRAKVVSEDYIFSMGVHHLQGLRFPFDELA